MKLVFVNRFFYPDMSATSQILSDAAFYLSREGYDVHIVTSRLAYEGDDVFPKQETIRGVTIHRLWTTRFGRSGLAGRAMDYLSFYLSVFTRLLLLLDRDDCVIAKTDPPMVSVPVSWAAKVRKAKLINWLQDLFPEVAESLGMRVPLAGLMYYLRDRSLQAARRNIAIGEHMRTRLLKLGLYSDRTAVVPNWTDDVAIQPLQKLNSLRSEWQLDGQFVVAYSGNLGRAHEIDTLLRAIEILQDKTDITFLFVGGGALMKELSTQVHARSLKHCLFKSYQPREQLPLTLTLPDVHLTILRPEMEGLIVPSKIYGVLAAGRPSIFVGDPEGELGSLLSVHDAGLVVKTGDGEALAQAILDLQSDASLCASMSCQARSLLEASFSSAQSLDKLKEAILC